MKNVRIYKDDIRTHVLRSLFLTNTVLAVGGGLLLAGLLYLFFTYILRFFDWGYFALALITLEVFFIGFVTQKVDNQPIYAILPRALRFKKNKKDLRHADIDSYFIDFTVQDNMIVRNKSLVRVYEVEPYDIALLNTQDRQHFFAKLKQVVNTLPSRVQIIVRKEKAQVKDFTSHFFSLYNDSNKKRERLIKDYVTDMSSLVTNNDFTSIHHYAIFSADCDTSKTDSKVKGMKKLSDAGIRFGSALAACNINIKPLKNDQLLSFVQTTLR